MNVLDPNYNIFIKMSIKRSLNVMNNLICYCRMFVGLFCIYFKSLIVFPVINPDKFNNPDKDDKHVTFSEVDRDYDTLSVMTYNIHSGFDVVFRLKINEMIQEIKKHRPDILCLQEVSSPEMYEHIKNSIGYTSGVYNDNKCIMTDGNIQRFSYVYFDPLRFYRKSGFIVADITLNNTDITVINSHLTSDISLFKQEAEIKELKEYINANKLNEHKLIVAGDFNYPDLELCGYVINNFSEQLRLEQIKPGCTFPSWMPIIHLDRIFYNNIVIKNHKKIESKNSDHYPVLAFFI